MWTYTDFTRYLADSICSYAITVSPQDAFVALADKASKESYKIACRQSISSTLDRITFVVDKVFPAAVTLAFCSTTVYVSAIETKKAFAKGEYCKMLFPGMVCGISSALTGITIAVLAGAVGNY